MFANVFFQIATVSELQDYVQSVNALISRDDRRLVVANDYLNVEGAVADAVELDPSREPLQVLSLIDGEYDGEDYFAVHFPTVERPTLELQSSRMAYDEDDVVPVHHTDAAPVHLAALINNLNFNA